MRMYQRRCPECDNELFYSSSSHLTRAISCNTVCKPCNTKKMHEKNRKYFHNKLEKECPNCKSLIKFTTKYKYNRSIENNSVCFSCSKTGDKNPAFGLVGEKSSSYGLIRSDELRQKISLVRKLGIKERGITGRPTYSIKACEYLDGLSVKMGWNLVHAKNGGEFYIKGIRCWVDGYDKDRNIVVEYDERHHYTTGELRKIDKDRMNKIKGFLNCDFYRYNSLKDTLVLW